MFEEQVYTDNYRLKANYHGPKAKWSEEEDKKLKQIVKRFGAKQWDKLAKFIPGRNGKQCRERWITNLSPDVNNGPWTTEEDNKLLELQGLYGNKWSHLSHSFNGRTPIAIKNRFKYLQKRSSQSTFEVIEVPEEIAPIQGDFDFDIFNVFDEFVC